MLVMKLRIGEKAVVKKESTASALGRRANGMAVLLPNKQLQTLSEGPRAIP